MIKKSGVFGGGVVSNQSCQLEKTGAPLKGQRDSMNRLWFFWSSIGSMCLVLHKTQVYKD